MTTSSTKRVLYHGTGAARWWAIQREGLLPRSRTGRRSNWTGDIASRPRFVYLTDAYPVYYALAAVRPNANLLILRVEVDETTLYPDEDFVAWVMAEGDPDEHRELIPHANPAEHQHLWAESLRFNGVVCTPTVPREQVTARKVLRPDAGELILNLGGDAMPTPHNYLCLGARYRTALEALFERGEDAAAAVFAESVLPGGPPDEK